jgi:hypothetical protein
VHFWTATDIGRLKVATHLVKSHSGWKSFMNCMFWRTPENAKKHGARPMKGQHLAIA